MDKKQFDFLQSALQHLPTKPNLYPEPMYDDNEPYGYVQFAADILATAQEKLDVMRVLGRSGM